MRKFIVIAYKPGDKFYIKNSSEKTLEFYCKGLTDLRNTIRCLTPKGYRVKSPQWFGKHCNGSTLKLQSMFGANMFDVQECSFPNGQEPHLKAPLECTNSFGFTHTLKIIDNGEILATDQANNNEIKNEN
jgi:hypothetical protein